MSQQTEDEPLESVHEGDAEARSPITRLVETIDNGETTAQPEEDHVFESAAKTEVETPAVGRQPRLAPLIRSVIQRTEGQSLNGVDAPTVADLDAAAKGLPHSTTAEEEVLKEVLHMDKLINAAASVGSLKTPNGGNKVAPKISPTSRRNSSLGITSQRSFQLRRLEKQSSASALGPLSDHDSSIAVADHGDEKRNNGVWNIGRATKVVPHNEGKHENGVTNQQPRKPSRKLEADKSFRNRRTSTENRRSSFASIKDDVAKLAQTVSRIFDKSANAVDEKRRAKVAELVNREAMVLNANQLAQMQRRNAHPFTISCHSTFRHWLDFVVTVSLAYVVSTTPIKVGFGVKTSGMGYVLDVIVDSIYLVEMILNFFTSYEDDTTGEEIKDLVKIRQNYVKTWFLMDAVSGLPASLIGEQNDLLTLSKILKVARVAKIADSGLIRTITGRIDRTTNPSLMRMAKLTFLFFISQHFIACSYYYISMNYSAQTGWGPSAEVMASPLLQKYIDAVYFAMMVTTANDVNPVTAHEKLFVSVMLFIGIVINASIIGSAANLLSNLDKEAIARKNQMDSINDYLRFKKVPLQLQNKIRRFYEYALNSRVQDPTENLFADLPDRLKLLLKLNLHAEFIRKVPLFKVCSHAGVIAIVQCLNQVVVMPGDIVISQGELSTEFYFIKSGQVSLCVRALAQVIPLGNLGEGSFFGEASLLTGKPATAEVKAERICELAYLSKDNFAAIIAKFPTFRLAIEKISESRLQTAQNVQKMSKLNRRQTQALSSKKLSFRGAAFAAVKKSRQGQRLGALGARSADGRPRRTMTMRFSAGRRMSLPTFDTEFVDKLSLAQARSLTNIQSVNELVVDPDDEDVWD